MKTLTMTAYLPHLSDLRTVVADVRCFCISIQVDLDHFNSRYRFAIHKRPEFIVITSILFLIYCIFVLSI